MLPLVITSFCLLTTLTGGLVAHRVRDSRHLFLGAAAGLMLGVVLFDLLPEALDQNSHTIRGIPIVLIMLALGFMVLHAIERLTGSHDRRGHNGHTHSWLSNTAVLPLICHSLLDGVGIGLSFQAGTTVGIIVSLAVITHDAADGFNTYTVYMLFSGNRRNALRWLLVDALAPIAGAGSTLFFHVSTTILGVFLGLFAGVLLYLASSDVLPEAHASHPSKLTLISTLAGLTFIGAVVALA